MSAEESIYEQRASFRCAVPESRQFCELKIGSNLLPATLLDESAGGFSVLVDRPPGLSVEQVAKLHTITGWFIVRVVHIAAVVPLQDDDEVAAEEPEPWFRLGLSRLGETEAPRPPRISLFARSLLSTVWPSSGGGGGAIEGSHPGFYGNRWRSLGGRSTIVLGMLLAVIAVVAPFAPVGVIWDASPSKPEEIAPWSDELTRLIGPSEPPPSPASPDPASSPAITLPVWDGQVNAVFRTERELRELVRRLPGPATLAIPEVARELQLSAAQQERIRQLIEATSQAARILDARSQGQQRQEIARQRAQLLDEARRRAIEVLTDQQRTRWDEIVGRR